MPIFKLTGVVLGHQEKPYDFKDDSGERVSGVTRVLWLWDDNAGEPIRVKVPPAKAGLVDAVGRGELVSVNVGVFARGNRTEFSFDSVEAA